ncbi:lysoplasmalogenase [Jhaorihella thermophila]|uniref:Uncharacterized membrane protein YhhN n=1 Tax=Jhaorihella thermophila TaxID=488547 RepID=A0A1H5XQ82_9RHOB|nr:lysoplasmalogenase [Jhaorihella thermophila]SEG13645.1 Uncharacterized membrane protein YhhN [Jhaorihella thermophila]
MTLPIALATLCAAAYLVLTTQAPSLTRSVIKTAAVALLAAFVWMAGGPPLLTVALALCALGDWLLSRETDQGFMAGVGAFAGGHLAYSALFLTQPQADPGRITSAPGLWVAAALATAGLVVAWILARRAGPLRGPVLAYIPIIIGMGISALALPFVAPLAAALAFIASDLILAAEKFLLPDRHPARRATAHAVWLLYWGAQAGFVAAFT